MLHPNGPVTRWGIVGSGKIAHDFIIALRTLPVLEHQIFAIAARDYDRAEKFAKRFGIPCIYGDYNEMARNSSVDVVYIATVNSTHYCLSQMFLLHGKHVLCEKPMCLNRTDTKDLIETAVKCNKFLMEGVWSRCFPAYKALKELMGHGTIGEIMQINANLSFVIHDIERIKSRELGGGSLLDLGTYGLQFQQFVYGNKLPKQILATGEMSNEGVDYSMTAIIKYAKGETAMVSSSTTFAGSNCAEILGTEGFIKIPNFWCPDKLFVNGQERSFPLPHTYDEINFINSTGLAYEAAEVRKCLLAGKLESDVMSHEDSRHLAFLRDEIRKKIDMPLDTDEDEQVA